MKMISMIDNYAIFRMSDLEENNIPQNTPKRKDWEI